MAGQSGAILLLRTGYLKKTASFVCVQSHLVEQPTSGRQSARRSSCQF